MNSNRPRLIVLCVELQVVRAITAVFEHTCDLAWVRDAKSAVALATQQPAPVAILVDNAVPHVPSLEVLKSIREANGSIRRILISDYCDLSLIVQGLHTGAAERIVYKPVAARDLAAAVGLPVTTAPTAQGTAPVRAAG